MRSLCGGYHRQLDDNASFIESTVVKKYLKQLDELGKQCEVKK